MVAVAVAAESGNDKFFNAAIYKRYSSCATHDYTAVAAPLLLQQLLSASIRPGEQQLLEVLLLTFEA